MPQGLGKVAVVTLALVASSQAGVYRNVVKPASVKAVRVSGHALKSAAKLIKKAAY